MDTSTTSTTATTTSTKTKGPVVKHVHSHGHLKEAKLKKSSKGVFYYLPLDETDIYDGQYRKDTSVILNAPNDLNGKVPTTVYHTTKTSSTPIIQKMQFSHHDDTSAPLSSHLSEVKRAKTKRGGKKQKSGDGNATFVSTEDLSTTGTANTTTASTTIATSGTTSTTTSSAGISTSGTTSSL